MARKQSFTLRATKVTSVKIDKQNFAQEMIKDLTPPFKAAAKMMEKEAKRIVPVETGKLRNSIKAKVIIGAKAPVTKKGTGKFKVPIGIDMRATAPYAAFVEYGTGERGRATHIVRGPTPAGFQQKPLDYTHGVGRGQKAQPFIRPAMIKALKAMQIGRL